MLRLRLFRKNDLSSQIESRTLDEGELVVGRDAKADWAIADPDRGISRRHLAIASRGGLVTLRDTSSNGVFLGDRRERVEPNRAVPIERGESIRFGDYVIVIEEDRHPAADAPMPVALDAPFERPGGGAEPDERARRERHPFASALRPDPFGGGGEVGSSDAWESRNEAPAGTWDADARRRPEHNALIGTDRPWVELPPIPTSSSGAGYAFDTPFERPILERTAPVPSGATAIPSDWMDAASEPEPAPAPVSARTSDPVIPTVAAPVAVEASAPQEPPVPDLLLSEPLRPEPARSGEAPVQVPAAGITPPLPDASDTALFEHFCAGAGINPQQFAGEDRARVMERLGGVYRQAVLGIADLMRDRTTLRNEYRMVHTAVQPEGNNPFKWVPPQRIAVELLRDEDGGYTTGERALADALHDVKAHLLCTLAGMRAALAATFGALGPAQVEARLGGRGYLIAVQRDAALWAEYVAMAEALRLEAEDDADGLVNRAFRHGYEKQAAEIISGLRPWR